ncbi:MAG: TetR/AcrR family transcriptional regulator [Bacteroidota bacterium]
MDKKQLILDAALKLFVEYGFHNTPTSKIAKEAGVANGTLFYFYPTKDELVKALYIDIKSRMTACMYENIQTGSSLRDIMKQYYSSSLQWTLAHATEFRFVEQFNTSAYLKQIAAEEVKKHMQPAMDLISKGIKDKVLKPMDVDMLFTLIGGHTFGVNQYLVSKQFSKAKQTQVIEETFEMLWGMIKN